MKYLTIILVLTFITSLPIANAGAIHNVKPDNLLFTQVLKEHVANGVVNYKAIKSDERFARYLTMLKSIDTATVDQNERLAFWINMYNAWTIKVVIDNYPLKSIKDLGADMVIGTILKTTIWDKDLVEIHGMKMSLNDIEHEIIRKYRDARIHFAIVCASKSCPALRSEAYEGEKLNAQLSDQTKLFIADTTRNKLNLDKKEIRLSKIFSWFEADFKKDRSFEKGNGSVIKFISRYVPKETADKLLANEKDFDVGHLDYDWSLNE